MLQNYSKKRALPKKEFHKDYFTKTHKEKKEIREDFNISANLSVTFSESFKINFANLRVILRESLCIPL